MFKEEGFIDFLMNVSPNTDTLEELKLTMQSFTSGEFDDDVSVISIKVL
jgi:hypothetical protein